MKFDVLKPDAETTLGKVQWGRVVVDEAQCLASGVESNTQIFQAACKLRAHARWALTGTPVGNSMRDFLSLLIFLRAAPYDNEADFEERCENADELIRMLAATTRRRTKGREASDKTPRKFVQLIHVTPTPEEQEAHDEAVEETANFLAKMTRSRMAATGLTAPTATVEAELRSHGLSADSGLGELDAFARRERLTNWTKPKDARTAFRNLVSEVTWARIDKHALLRESSKWIALRALLVDMWGGRMGTREFAAPPPEECHLPENQRDFVKWTSEFCQRVDVETDRETKVVIFSNFPTRAFEIAELMLRELDVDFCRIDGTTNPKARKRAIDAFRADPNKRVFLIGLKSGGCGINLQVAKVGILLDVWWNPAPERQAIDRVHRKGSRHADNYFFKFATSNTDDCDRVLEKNKEKEEIIEDYEKSALGTVGTASEYGGDAAVA